MCQTLSWVPGGDVIHRCEQGTGLWPLKFTPRAVILVDLPNAFHTESRSSSRQAGQRHHRSPHHLGYRTEGQRD